MLELFITIDEHGDLFLDPDSPPITNPIYIEEIHQNLRLTENFVLVTEFQDQEYIVESFDHPLHIIAVEFKNKNILLQTKQNTLFQADQAKWAVDEWDRFTGLTSTNAPFVLTKKAQEQIFDLVDSFDDEGFVASGQYVATPPYYISNPEIEKPKHWVDIYTNETNPRYNLNDAAEAFKDMMPRLKLPKSRILVLGCGEGHDAALFARAGHVVTAVDFSKEAIKRGKEKYSDLTEKLIFYESDIFHLPQEWSHSFDVVIEHTCYCAIAPEKRNELVKIYRRMLHEEGQLLSVFFTMDKRMGPPFGATEWEIRKRTEPYFHYLFWGRLRNSLPQRQGRELFVLAKKKK